MTRLEYTEENNGSSRRFYCTKLSSIGARELIKKWCMKRVQNVTYIHPKPCHQHWYLLFFKTWLGCQNCVNVIFYIFPFTSNPHGVIDLIGEQKTRKILTEKIAQLNSAIDDVSSQLRANDVQNGAAVVTDEVETAIWWNLIVCNFRIQRLRRYRIVPVYVRTSYLYINPNDFASTLLQMGHRNYLDITIERTHIMLKVMFV